MHCRRKAVCSVCADAAQETRGAGEPLSQKRDGEPPVSHLVDIFAVDAISAVARGTGSTFPAAVRVACTLGASKAGVGQAPI